MITLEQACRSFFGEDLYRGVRIDKVLETDDTWLFWPFFQEILHSGPADHARYLGSTQPAVLKATGEKVGVSIPDYIGKPSRDVTDEAKRICERIRRGKQNTKK